MTTENYNTETLQDYTVRANKGKPRIWIEGKRLIAAGFLRGERFTLTTHDTGIVLKLDAEGSRKVCGKGERPLIDLSGGGCSPMVTGDQVEIKYTPRQIEITCTHWCGAR